VDNDCDGDANELTNTIHAGDACTAAAQGTCANGTRACFGTNLVCNASSAGTEVCDPTPSKDENCNGTANENCPCNQGDTRTSPPCGQGICRRTVNQTCDLAGAWGPACTPGAAGTESCNTLDDDCDGVVNNGLTKDETCGFGACQRTQTQTCSAAGIWSPACVSGAAASEVCDGLDNNCNNQTDENLCLNPPNTQCYPAGAGTCDPVARRCVFNAYPLPHACDLDNRPCSDDQCNPNGNCINIGPCPVNQAPKIVVAPAFTTTSGGQTRTVTFAFGDQRVKLDASQSTDVNQGDTLRYTWTQINSTAATAIRNPSGSNQPVFEFTAPPAQLGKSITAQIQVTVSDGSDSVTSIIYVVIGPACTTLGL
jgi:hypothetical protein